MDIQGSARNILKDTSINNIHYQGIATIRGIVEVVHIPTQGVNALSARSYQESSSLMVSGIETVKGLLKYRKKEPGKLKMYMRVFYFYF